MIPLKHSPAFRQSSFYASFFVLFFIALLFTALQRVPNVHAHSTSTTSNPIVVAQSSASTSDATAPCTDQLPQVEWLGEGAATYELGQDFDTFIVKRRPFHFATEPGRLNDQGQLLYSATKNERVWRCQGNCAAIALGQEAFDLGTVPIGATIHLVAIDDDGIAQNDDQRTNWWAVDDATIPYAMIEEQSMVEYLSLAVPVTGNWFFYAEDSMGIVTACIQEAAPTPTAVPTVAPINTPTVTAVVTVPPTVPVLPTETPTTAPTAITETPTTAPTTITETPTTAPTTITETPTTAPTEVPTPAPSVTPGGSSAMSIIYVGATDTVTVDGITVDNEDILLFDTISNQWALYFDGSDVGLDVDMNAFHLEADGTFLFSPFIATTLPNIGPIDRGDIIRFTPITLGENTTGNFAMVLDGSDVGVESPGENFDAIARAPDGRLVVSSYGTLRVDDFKAESKDLIVFNDSSLGEETSGSWEIYLDGGDIGLSTNSENINGLWIDSASGQIYLSTFLDFTAKSTNSLEGDSNDIFICVPESLGEDSQCTFLPFWDGAAFGFGFMIDTMSFGDSLPNLTTGTKREEVIEEPQPMTVFLPFVQR